jgi:hypothetical protein
MDNFLTIIGDCHGKFDQYKSIIKESEYSIQLGDMGFDYSAIEDIDTDHHVWIAGNHDNWSRLTSKLYTPGYLGRYGVHTMNGIKFFFISGGYSIDDGYRREHRARGGAASWWHQEELNFTEMEACKKLYLEEKPEILLTHSPCRYTISDMTNSRIVEKFGFDKDFYCQTSHFYDHLFTCHKPKLHVFAHMHQHYEAIHHGILNICLPELATFDLTQGFIDSL